MLRYEPEYVVVFSSQPSQLGVLLKETVLVPALHFKYTEARSHPSDTRLSLLLVEALLEQG